MPVIGHIFVGIATGLATVPRHSDKAHPLLSSPSLWLASATAAAYLPDIFSQTAAIAGWQDGRLLAHSLLFALLVPPALAALPCGMLPFSGKKVFGFTFLSIILHDFMDLLQSTDRIPLWPFIDSPLLTGSNILPAGPFVELLIFGLGFGMFVTAYAIAKKNSIGKLFADFRGQGTAAWIGRAALILIIAAAGLTHSLREKRERLLYEAHELLNRKEYAKVIQAAEQAIRWPSTARPGRVDYLMAAALSALGHSKDAEYHYLRSYRSDPDYFWCLADLAVFYASSELPLAQRRLKASPYLQRLREDFYDHWDFEPYLSKIQTFLDAPNDLPSGD